MAGKRIAAELNDLHKQDENDAAGDENIEPEPLVAVANGQVAQTTSAHRAGHGREIDHGDGQNRKRANETWNRFGKIDLPYCLRRGCTQRDHSLDKDWIDIEQCCFDKPR